MTAHIKMMTPTEAKLVPVGVQLLEGKKRPKAQTHYRNRHQRHMTQTEMFKIYLFIVSGETKILVFGDINDDDTLDSQVFGVGIWPSGYASG